MQVCTGSGSGGWWLFLLQASLSQVSLQVLHTRSVARISGGRSYIFYGTGCSATIKRLLRRTLVRSGKKINKENISFHTLTLAT